MTGAGALEEIANDYIRGVFAGEVLWADDYASIPLSVTALGCDQIDAASTLRKQTLVRLSRLDPQSAGQSIGHEQITDWVSAEDKLMDSGEQWRLLNSMRSPQHRVSRVLWSALLEAPIDWDYVVRLLEALGAAYSAQVQSLSKGLDRGIVGGRSEAEYLYDECNQIAEADGEPLLELLLGKAAARPEHATVVGAAIASVRTGAAELRDFLLVSYLPRAQRSSGVGRERYFHWCAVEFGPGFDLEELYESCWVEIRELDREIASVANSILPGSTPRQVVGMFNRDPTSRMVVGDGLLDWIQEESQRVAEALDEAFIPVPQQYRSVHIVLDSVLAPATVSVLPGHPGGARSGSFHLRPVDVSHVPTWSLRSLVHGFVFPGLHLLNSYLDDTASSLTSFQRVLASQCAKSGWAAHSMSLVSDLARHRDDLRLLMSALYAKRRQIIRAGCDIGYHMGFELPDYEPGLAGQLWSEDLVQEAFRRWGYLTDDLARAEAVRLVRSPAYGVAGVVGGRVREESLRRTRIELGSRFYFRDYYDQAIRIAPTGAAGLESQLSALSPSG